MKPSRPPRFALQASGAGARLVLEGDWTTLTLQHVEDALARLALRAPLTVDVTALGQMDTAGARVLLKALEGAGEFTLAGDHPSASALLDQVRTLGDYSARPQPKEDAGLISLLERIGKGLVDFSVELSSTLAFFGHSVSALGRAFARPTKMRWNSIVSVMESAGVNAMPIIAFLSFFVGMVIAYIGATTLREFALEIYTVELVGYSMLREFGVVLAGIVLAGRTNSAFTAEIGSMKMRQEIDAMQTLGLRPMQVLTVPRLIAMTLMTPILTFVATVAGIAGGAVVAWISLDISPAVFMERLRIMVPVDQFLIGLSKAPVFGFVTALIACRQGLLTGGSVQSLGERVTASVVQAIFAVIVLDALFAIFYMELGI